MRHAGQHRRPSPVRLRAGAMTLSSGTPDKARKASAPVPIPGVAGGGVKKRRHSAAAVKPVHSASASKLQARDTVFCVIASGDVLCALAWWELV